MRAARCERFARYSEFGCGGNSHVLVCSPVVKKPPLAVAHESFDEHYIRDLPSFFPLETRAEDWLVFAGENLGRINFIKHEPARPVNTVVVYPVIDQ